MEIPPFALKRWFDRPGRFRIGFGLPTAALREGLDRVAGVMAERA